MLKVAYVQATFLHQHDAYFCLIIQMSYNYVFYPLIWNQHVYKSLHIALNCII